MQVTASTTSGSTGTATVSVYVDPGPVLVTVKGGLFCSSAVDSPLLLDASGSQDLNLDPLARSTRGSSLSFSWDCKIISVTGYGDRCFHIFDSRRAVNTSKISIVNMTLSYLYSVSVVAIAADGRSSSESVTVTPTFPGSAKVIIQSTATKFNSGSSLKLITAIRAATAQVISWSVLDPSIDLAANSLTLVSKNFSAADMRMGVQFPLAMQPNVFNPGKSYTFRVSSVSINDTSVIGFGDIILLVNAPPSSGSFLVSPKNGTAVTTLFSLTAANWIDDPAGLTRTLTLTLTRTRTRTLTLTLTLTLSCKSTLTLFSLFFSKLCRKVNKLRTYGITHNI